MDSEYDYHLWYYVRDIAIHNKKGRFNTYIPTDILRCIFSYVLLNIKEKINYNFICNTIYQQLTFPNRSHSINHYSNTQRPSSTREVKVNVTDLPYDVTSLNLLHSIIENMVRHRGYIYKYYQNAGSVIVFEKYTYDMRNRIVYHNGEISWK